MNSLSKMYKLSFFGRRDKLLWRAPILCNIIQEVFSLQPAEHSIVDAGCAIGEFVQEFQKRGFDAYGIEGSPNAQKYSLVPLIIIDLRRPIKWRDSHTLCMCLEVAEHIEPEYVDIFVENLTRLSNTILISAAPPGQRGHNHFNCQTKEYWVEKFDNFRYIENLQLAYNFQEALRPYKKKKGLSAYFANTMVFEKGE